MRYGSVCSGIEAASVAWHHLGWQPAFFSEVDRFPCEVLAHHYGSNLPGEDLARNGVPNLGDMTRFQEWPDHAIDLLVGGTPCQSFSVAGLRAGLADPRGNLMLTYLAIAARYRPRWLVWENVPGVLSSGDGRDFGTFLQGLGELGYGYAYRVLDAQFVRVDGFPHAVPQRRRRVFVVGYLGDWRRAAAVFFDGASLRGDPPPRREAGQIPAGTIDASLGRRRGSGMNPNQMIGLAAAALDVSPTLRAGGNKTGGDRPPGTDVDTADSLVVMSSGQANAEIRSDGGAPSLTCLHEAPIIAHVAPAVTSNPYGDHESREGLLVAHALRAEGFDASEDGSGRGAPIVPVVAASLTRGAESAGKGGYAGRRQEDDSNLVAQVAYGIRNDAARDGEAKTPSRDAAGTERLRAPGFNVYEGLAPTLDAGAPHSVAHALEVQAVAFDARQRDVIQYGNKAGPIDTDAFSQAVLTKAWAVRRLTPKECERLQGFPDGYTDIPRVNGRAAADGPRYKALGNSMAVNAMAWIGERIAMVEAMAE